VLATASIHTVLYIDRDIVCEKSFRHGHPAASAAAESMASRKPSVSGQLLFYGKDIWHCKLTSPSLYAQK
jgi:hypothetical protein